MSIKINRENVSVILVLLALLIDLSQKLAVHRLLALVLLICLLFFKMLKTRYSWFYTSAIVFGFFVAISYIWAVTDPLTNTGASSILTEYFIILLVMLIICERSKDEKYILKLITVFNIANLLYCSYIFLNTPLGEWGQVYIGDTIGIGKNAVGMRCAWGILFAFYLCKEKRKKMAFYIICMTIYAVFVAFSGSRKAILIAVFGVALFQIFLGGNRKIVRNLLIGTIIVTLTMYFLFNNEVLYRAIGNRMKNLVDVIFRQGTADGAWLERNYYKMKALEMFKNSPFFGYGINGFMVYMKHIGYYHVAYSHCNYTEILANYGLIGIVLFYIPRFAMIINVFRKKMYKINPMYALLFTALLVQLVMDYEMVSYYSVSAQFIFCLAAPLLAISSSKRSKENPIIEV